MFLIIRTLSSGVRPVPVPSSSWCFQWLFVDVEQCDQIPASGTLALAKGLILSVHHL